MGDAAAERRKRNRERMAKIRARRRRKKRCRNCEKRVAVSPRTGKPSRFCEGHLAAERARKTPPELPWGEPRSPLEVAKWARDMMHKAYKLRWLT